MSTDTFARDPQVPAVEIKGQSADQILAALATKFGDCLYIYDKIAGGEGGIRTSKTLMESVSYSFHVPRDATNATVAGAACPILPDGFVSLT
jgi:hypothetical protein